MSDKQFPLAFITVIDLESQQHKIININTLEILILVSMPSA